MISLIPAIDIIDGKCVRLTQGDYGQKKIYSERPVEVARQFEAAGIRRLHLVDLDGAKAGKVMNMKVLESISTQTRLIIDYGGGIKCNEDVEAVFSNGATMISVGSVAVREPELFHEWVRRHGPDRVLLGADVKDEKIAIHGWTEVTGIGVFDFISLNKMMGVKNFFCTDIAKDGVMEGPAVELYKRILSRVKGINLVASGGVTSLDDIRDLEAAGCSGVIIGKAIYEGKITMKELEQFN
jgi:phosphoribosylformimino-5-aminoimidazole carboxamide ribotide isomerase